MRPASSFLFIQLSNARVLAAGLGTKGETGCRAACFGILDLNLWGML